MNALKMCCDCKWWGQLSGYSGDFYKGCAYPGASAKNMTNGKAHEEAHRMRASFWRCGKDARWFEPKLETPVSNHDA